MSPAGFYVNFDDVTAWYVGRDYASTGTVNTNYLSVCLVISLKADTLVTSRNNGSSEETAYVVVTQ